MSESSDDISEKGALQLLFDFRYMIKLVEGGWPGNPGKEALAKEILLKIKSKIDPIDLAVADMAIVSNVERHYLRTMISLGSFLILNPKPIELYLLLQFILGNEPRQCRSNTQSSPSPLNHHDSTSCRSQETTTQVHVYLSRGM